MTNHMKALVKARAEEGLWMERVPVPEPGPQEVLIKVRKSAICGTDVHIWEWDEWSARTVPVPMVVGHEFCGEIVDYGNAVKKSKLVSVFQEKVMLSAESAGIAVQDAGTCAATLWESVSIAQAHLPMHP